MSPESVVEAHQLSKRFKIYNGSMPRLADWLSLPGGPRYREFWALRNVSFELKQGECLGVIGPNGAGKTTLLKLLTGVLTPTAGDLNIRGRVLSLLELGSDFNPELTGRNNVRESLQLLEIPSGDIAAHIDEIAAFAELGDYFDRPVKMYSSGMFVRLAFSLFSTLQPEVFLVDEALTVGDLRFSGKALARIQQMRARGTTLLFVSHNLEVVAQLCTRVIWVQSGQVQADGSPHAVTAAYLQFMLHGGGETPVGPPGEIFPDIESISALPNAGGVVLGDGWQSLEAFGGEVFRWAGATADLVIDDAPDHGELILEVEAVDAGSTSGQELCVDSGLGTMLQFTITGRQVIRIPLPELIDQHLRVRLVSPDPPHLATGDDRLLAFRLFRWGWSDTALESVQSLPTTQALSSDTDVEHEISALRIALQQFQPISTARARITHVITRNQAGDTTVRFTAYDPITLEVTVEATSDLPGLVVGMEIKDMYGRSLYRTRNDLQSESLPSMCAGERTTLRFHCPRLLLGHGLYQVTVGAGGQARESEIWHLLERAWSFEVHNTPGAPIHGMVDLDWRYMGSRSSLASPLAEIA